MENLNDDVLLLIFDYLVGDSAALSAMSLTCHAWHSLSLPFLLDTVDLSYHNQGRIPDLECSLFLVVMADSRAMLDQGNLQSRQRAFLRLMTERPDLTHYVHTFVWSFIWLLDDDDDGVATQYDEDGHELEKFDYRTWEVFSRLTSVRNLDLACLYTEDVIKNPYVRQSPEVLFPGVTSLRLVGFMHRGLVRAIINSLDTRNLRSLTLDRLLDESALPNGMPMSEGLAREFCHAYNLRKEPYIIGEALYQRQEKGTACIFPGPMWAPLRMLSSMPLKSLTNLQISLEPFDPHIDARSYKTMFHEVANVVLRASETLKSLVILLGEDPRRYDPPTQSGCGNATRTRIMFEPYAIQWTAEFLNEILEALSKTPFPQLRDIRTEGFHAIETLNEDHRSEEANMAVKRTRELIGQSPFQHINFTEKRNVDYRLGFDGYPTYDDSAVIEKFGDVLESSGYGGWKEE